MYNLVYRPGRDAAGSRAEFSTANDNCQSPIKHQPVNSDLGQPAIEPSCAVNVSWTESELSKVSYNPNGNDIKLPSQVSTIKTNVTGSGILIGFDNSMDIWDIREQWDPDTGLWPLDSFPVECCVRMRALVMDTLYAIREFIRSSA